MKVSGLLIRYSNKLKEDLELFLKASQLAGILVHGKASLFDRAGGQILKPSFLCSKSGRIFIDLRSKY